MFCEFLNKCSKIKCFRQKFVLFISKFYEKKSIKKFSSQTICPLGRVIFLQIEIGTQADATRME